MALSVQKAEAERKIVMERAVDVKFGSAFV